MTAKFDLGHMHENASTWSSLATHGPSDTECAPGHVTQVGLAWAGLGLALN
ncbi:hypothetical protein IMZ48_05885 [Candidatus Bathyarchaeota archaeon]|nr:hypothetical protein [Candidatus Bathyarchaeota archaeon]